MIAAQSAAALRRKARNRRCKHYGGVSRHAAQLPVRIKTRGVPVYLYAPLEEVEEQARQQLISIAESPLPVDHVSAMPDIHMGKGVAIGCVFASEKYVCPNAVGVDIGCGMCAVPIEGLFKDDLNPDMLRRMQTLVKERVPTGFNEHRMPLDWTRETIKNISAECPPSNYLEARISKEQKVTKQLGSLGGGNHFIELVYAEGDERVWCMLHSGSRNIGNTTAEYYDKLAGTAGTELRGVSGSLNYLDVNSKEGQGYLQDMTWCQAYARENRRSMLQLFVDTVEEVTGKKAEMDRAVNAHHNFCQCETCTVKNPLTGVEEVKNLWVTRKGATSAREGQYGIIPGSMGTGSYIVKGRGASDSWQSCSHGAGRRMSRTAAKKQIQQEDFEKVMEGIVCDTVAAVRDEAPQAYKDLSVVLQHQTDLVEVEHRLLPLLNVKGYEEYKSSKGNRGKRRNRSKNRRK